MAVPPISEESRNLFKSLIEHHLRFTLAKRRIQLSKADWYRATAMVVRDMLVEKMLATEGHFERRNAKKMLLPVARISDRPLAREQPLQPRHDRRLPRVPRRKRASICNCCSTTSPTRRSATAAWAGWPPVFSIRSRRSTCPATATASTTSTASSGRKSATATRSNSPTTGSAKSRRGWSSGPRTPA